MGKKKDKECTHGSDHQTRSASVEAQSQPQDSAMNTVKKPKKHKHKKSSKKEEVERIINVEDIEDVDISVDDIDDSPTQGLKLKIKLPDSSPEKPTTPKSVKVKSEKTKTSGSKKSGKKKDGKGEDDTDSEEERWLDAIESGKLEEVDDELKRMKNPRLMTARQRAMLEKEKKSDGTDDTFPVIPAEPLLSLPSGRYQWLYYVVLLDVPTQRNTLAPGQAFHCAASNVIVLICLFTNHLLLPKCSLYIEKYIPVYLFNVCLIILRFGCTVLVTL
ncbi:INO80 complex subunit B-like [Homarus americanus]|uniref:INO80 complex subunit B-like n=1 Tax=Homarus americanus TaxID=6706 RepID=A0A8J5JKE6_HOMAM|nr:INO80 complex subunit B-like [Homarus americanus]